MAKTSREYWTEREERHRKSLVRDEKKLASEINDTYARMIREANNQIAEWYQKYATKEGITLAEAKRRVSSLDIKEYSEKAKQYVKDRDMSEQANQEMRLYNLTMKVNRLELLKSEIGMHMAGGFNDIEKIIGVGLTEEARAEMRRQAGILGHTVLHNERAAEVIANSSFKNATFSDRIWQHQDMLKMELDRALQRGLIQGKNPRVLAKDIRKIFGASQKNAERLMITEMARAQIEAQKASYERNDYEEYMYIACGASDCCDECAALDGQIFPVKDMQPGVNAPPMHPYCHCSTAAYVDEEKYRRMLDEAAEQNRRAREEAEEEQTALLKKHGNLENLMLFGSPEEFTRWSELAEQTGMTEQDAINKLAEKVDNWEAVLSSQSKKHMEAYTDRLLATASDEELSALRLWTGEAYVNIARYMRYGVNVDPISKKAAKTIEQILSRMETPEDLILKRGTGIKHIFEKMPAGWQNDLSLLSGRTFSDKTFTATTPFMEGGFSAFGDNNATLYIKVPKGTHGAYIESVAHNEPEMEFLLQKGCKFRIIKAEYRSDSIITDKKSLYVWCEVLNDQ